MRDLPQAKAREGTDNTRQRARRQAEEPAVCGVLKCGRVRADLAAQEEGRRAGVELGTSPGFCWLPHPGPVQATPGPSDQLLGEEGGSDLDLGKVIRGPGVVGSQETLAFGKVATTAAFQAAQRCLGMEGSQAVGSLLSRPSPKSLLSGLQPG